MLLPYCVTLCCVADKPLTYLLPHLHVLTHGARRLFAYLRLGKKYSALTN